jgi:hypothetical protein
MLKVAAALKTVWETWCAGKVASIIAATWKVDIGRILFEVGPSKKCEALFEK